LAVPLMMKASPWDILPAISTIPYRQAVLIDLPICVKRSCGTCGFLVGWTATAGDRIVSGTPKARREVAQLAVWTAEPVP
jgi:hypothetical protein